MPDTNYNYARRLAEVTFCLDMFLQAAVLLSDVDQSYLYVAYTPHPYALLAMFVFQVLTQVSWIMDLYPDQAEDDNFDTKSTNFHTLYYDERYEDDEDETQGRNFEKAPHAQYLPPHLVGSCCQIGWSICWLVGDYSMCPVFLVVSLLAQVHVIFLLLGVSQNRGFAKAKIHLIAKSRVGIAILYLWKTSGVIDSLPPPTMSQQINNAIFCLILAIASGPDPTLGCFLAFDLFALTFGPHRNIGWRESFKWTGVLVSILVFLDWLVGMRVRKAILRREEFEEAPLRLYD